MLCGPAWAADAEPKAEPKAEVPATGPLTVEEVMAEPLTWGPTLSPSGRYLALLSSVKGEGVIHIADVHDETAKPVVFTLANASVEWVAWKSDDRLLYATEYWIGQLGNPLGPEDMWRKTKRLVSRVKAMDRDGKNVVTLFTGNAEALRNWDLTSVTDFRANDPQHIIMPAYRYQSRDLYLVNVLTGASERIAKGNPATCCWYTDRDGNAAFRIDHNWLGTLAYIYSRNGPGNVAADDLEWANFLTISLRNEYFDRTPDFYPYFPGPEPNSLYVVARPDGADTSGIYLYDFAAKKYLKTLATVPGIDIDHAYIDPHSLEYFGTRYYADRKVARLVNKTHQAHLDALDKYFGGEVDVYLEDYDRAMENWLLYTVGPRDRGSWHLYRVKDRFVRQVQHQFPVIDPQRLGTTKVVRYTARDGLEIMGYLTTPPNAPKDDPPPLIMLPHGGPELRDYYRFDRLVQLLASRGYRVFQPNFRGSSGFGERFADSGKREWGGAMQDDLTDAFEFLVKSGYATRERACIVGGSYGGYAALAAAAMTPDLYRCAVSIAGISDLPRWLKSDKRRFSEAPEIYEYMKRQLGDPQKDAAMLEARSPMRLAGAVKAPVLLIHGRDDQRVPVEQSRDMDDALRAAGKDVRYVEIKDAGHSLSEDGWRVAFAAILEFLDKHLPTTTAPPPASHQPAK